MTNSARRGPVLALAASLVSVACGALGGSGANATLCPPAALESVTVETKTFTPVTYAVLIDRAYTGDSKRSPVLSVAAASAHGARDRRGRVAEARSASR
jgi:hypothetical protein